MVTIRHIYDKHPYNLNVQAVLLNNKGIEQRTDMEWDEAQRCTMSFHSAFQTK